MMIPVAAAEELISRMVSVDVNLKFIYIYSTFPHHNSQVSFSERKKTDRGILKKIDLTNQITTKQTNLSYLIMSGAPYFERKWKKPLIQVV